MDITYLSDDTGYVDDVELHEPVDTEIMSDLCEYPNEVRKVFDRRTSSTTDPKIEKHSASEIIQLCKEIDLISAAIKSRHQRCLGFLWNPQCQNINEKHTTAGKHVFCRIRHNI
jgi:hypothetical protein